MKDPEHYNLIVSLHAIDSKSIPQLLYKTRNKGLTNKLKEY